MKTRTFSSAWRAGRASSPAVCGTATPTNLFNQYFGDVDIELGANGAFYSLPVPTNRATFFRAVVSPP